MSRCNESATEEEMLECGEFDDSDAGGEKTTWYGGVPKSGYRGLRIGLRETFLEATASSMHGERSSNAVSPV